VSKLIGISLIKHFEDGTTENWTKVSAPAVGAILAAGLATAPVTRSGSNTYINADECPKHGPWRAVPASISAKTNKPYNAFWACDQDIGEERCTNKPHSEWVETHPAGRGGDDASQLAPEPTAPPVNTAADFDDLPF